MFLHPQQSAHDDAARRAHYALSPIDNQASSLAHQEKRLWEQLLKIVGAIIKDR
jgi:hypothetical protein